MYSRLGVHTVALGISPALIHHDAFDLTGYSISSPAGNGYFTTLPLPLAEPCGVNGAQAIPLPDTRIEAGHSICREGHSGEQRGGSHVP
jgi:hypothetical protein